MTKMFWVPGIPQPQARPRFGQGRVYSPKTPWHQAVYLIARQHRPRPPLKCPIKVYARFHLPKTKRAFSAISRFWSCASPDLDNLAKSILDSMTRAQWWADDALVVELHCEKVVAESADLSKPGVRVIVEELAHRQWNCSP